MHHYIVSYCRGASTLCLVCCELCAVSHCDVPCGTSAKSLSVWLVGDVGDHFDRKTKQRSGYVGIDVIWHI